jgi:esterase/lipase superfamily enzyme
VIGWTLASECATSIPLTCSQDECGRGGSLPSDQGQSVLIDALRRAVAGKYEIVRELRRGTMTSMFQAREISLDSPATIEVLAPFLSAHLEVASLVRRAALSHASLLHPNIMPIYRIESDAGLVYWVMKYVSGPSLDEVMESNRRLPAKEVERVLVDVASALGYAHSRGIVHGDVRPANILFDSSGQVLLTDFGVTRAVLKATYPKGGFTTNGGLSTTPDYISPELAKGGFVDDRSDQYSLGVVGYRLLSGELPFAGGYNSEIAHKHIVEKVRPLPIDIPDHLAESVLRALSKRPAERFPTMEAFVQATQDKGPEEVAAQGPAPARVAREVEARDFPLARSPAKYQRRLEEDAGKVRVVPAEKPARVVWVFYVTDRQANASVGFNVSFGNRRGDLSYGWCGISVPPSHEIGVLERPSVFRLQFRESLKEHIAIVNVTTTSWPALIAGLKSELSETERKQCLLFVHGYNVSFEDAARRTGQLKCDLGFTGPTGFFSWPSTGWRIGYPIDENNVEWATPHLYDVLQGLAAELDVQCFHVIAHSMGNRAVTRALMDLKSKSPNLRSKFREIVLTAPDIDKDVFFTEILPALQDQSSRLTLYASKSDRALRASRWLHGYSRAGYAGRSIVVAPGLDTIDATAVSTDFLGHSYYGASRTILSDLFSLLVHGLPPVERFGLRAIMTKRGTHFEILP